MYFHRPIWLNHYSNSLHQVAISEQQCTHQLHSSTYEVQHNSEYPRILEHVCQSIMQRCGMCIAALGGHLSDANHYYSDWQSNRPMKVRNFTLLSQKGSISESMFIWTFCFILMHSIYDWNLIRPFRNTLIDSMFSYVTSNNIPERFRRYIIFHWCDIHTFRKK